MPQADPYSIVAVLENIRSMGNVGSMFRSADGAGVDRLLLCGFTAHPPRMQISKTALGADEFVAWEYWSRAAEAIAALRQQGYRILGLERTAESVEIESHFDAVKPDGPLAFAVGHETQGLSEGVLATCDQVVHLPMRGHKDSLNVAVAFGLAAYTLRRRRGHA